MKIKLLFASALLSLTTGSAIAEETKNSSAVIEASKVYNNKTFNPRQKEYPNHLYSGPLRQDNNASSLRG